MFKFKPATITTFPLELSARWWTKIFRKIWLIALTTITSQTFSGDTIAKFQELLRQIQNSTTVTTDQIEQTNTLVTAISNSSSSLESVSFEQCEKLRVSIRSTLLYIQNQRNPDLSAALRPAHLTYTDLADQLELKSISESRSESRPEITIPTSRFRTFSGASLVSLGSNSITSPTRQLSSPSDDSKSPELVVTRTKRFSPWHSEACFALLENPSTDELIRKIDSARCSPIRLSIELSAIIDLARNIRLKEISVEELKALNKSLADKLARFNEVADQDATQEIKVLTDFNTQVTSVLNSKQHKKS